MPKGGIKNYCSKMKPKTIVGKMEQMIYEEGGRRVTIQNYREEEEEGRPPKNIGFFLPYGEGVYEPHIIHPRIDKVHEKIKEGKGPKTRRQAFRTAWKNWHDLLVSAIALRKVERYEMAQFLLGFGFKGWDDDGSPVTVYDVAQEKALESGDRR